MDRQVRHLTGLMDDLLDITRVTTGKIVLHRRPIDLGAVVARCLATYEDSRRLARHQVSQSIASVWIDADETRIEQMAANLIGNALKFTPAGGTISVRVSREDADAVLVVEDSGAGISPELLPRIFDLFVQGDRTIERAAGGLGLGLTLVRRLAEMQAGTVEAASAGPGRGATFTVRLPCIPAPAAGGEDRRPAVVTPQARRILLVEDNADGRDMLRTMLVMQGHDVHEAADGPTAITAALAIRPEVAIIDIGLPGVDGYTVAARLRQDTRTRGMRLIALTGYGTGEDRQRAGEAGFDAHMTKPIDPERLARLLAV
jgi:CheY-like chemotaxis protein